MNLLMMKKCVYVREFDLINNFPCFFFQRHYVKKNEFRRVSVAAERYNPEDDNDSDNEESQVYSKTPEQRQRLKDAVCHNLLFRTLEAKQIDQILNAMWEKSVEQGETIIQQGN
jgi:hypothetical protein